MARADKADVFISHASEDKETFVRPLAERLQSSGVACWYDEWSLSLGDSLSRSIDRGLASCRFALVIISRAFISKRWPEQELRGLLARGVADDSIVLPVWHEISRAEVVAFSPILADLVALSSNEPLDEIVARVIDRVRPDLSQGFSHRRALDELNILAENAPIEWVKPSDLRPGPIRHDHLPLHLRNRIRIVAMLLEPQLGFSCDQMEENFRRDADPEREMRVWEAVTACFLHAGAPDWPLAEQRTLLRAALRLISGDRDGALEALSKLPDVGVSRAVAALNEVRRLP